MDDTLRSRLAKLLQRSRQALRLYSSLGREERGELAELNELQAAAWRTINNDLIRRLTEILEQPHSRKIGAQVCSLGQYFLNDFRISEGELQKRQRDLIASSERGDFVKCSLLSRELVALKAHVQASHAAHHEIQEVVEQSGLQARLGSEDGEQDQATHGSRTSSDNSGAPSVPPELQRDLQRLRSPIRALAPYSTGGAKVLTLRRAR